MTPDELSSIQRITCRRVTTKHFLEACPEASQRVWDELANEVWGYAAGRGYRLTGDFWQTRTAEPDPDSDLYEFRLTALAAPA